MNYIKEQKQIFNDLVMGKRVCGYWIDENKYFVTGDGYHGFVFPKETIAFDIKRVNEAKRLFDFEDARKEENELRETNNFKLIGGKMMRVFVHHDGRCVYINNLFLKHFQNAKYYQVTENGAVLVYEEIRDNVFPVGVVLPIRYSGGKEQ